MGILNVRGDLEESNASSGRKEDRMRGGATEPHVLLLIWGVCGPWCPDLPAVPGTPGTLLLEVGAWERLGFF